MNYVRPEGSGGAGTTTLKANATKAAQLKDAGNALFGQRQLDRAVEAYSQAIQLLREQKIRHETDLAHHRNPNRTAASHNDEKDLLLYAVVCSNRSACHYEMGQFDQSAIDASACIDYLDGLLREQHKFEHTLAHVPILSPADEAKAVSMRSDNQWRRTRALLYQHDGDLHKAQARLDFLSLKTEEEGVGKGGKGSSSPPQSDNC